MGTEFTFRGTGRHVIFYLGDRSYAIPIASVEEILPMAELSRVPGSPAFLAGFLNVGGQLVAVISLRTLFGMPDRESELYTPLVVLKSTGNALALEVDGVTQIVEIADGELVSITDDCSLNDYVTAVARLSGEPVLIVSPERLLFEQEQRRLSELAELERQRISALAGTTD